ncbi:MAG TPA: hypothetical protein VK171_14475 [Fimbriimonas sp.]|nr:hypothetical protein [Fimbriimonas sp.]
MHERTLGYSVRLLADIKERPPTVDTEFWRPAQDGALSGLRPTPNDALAGFEPLDTKRFCLVAVTVFDLDDFIEDVCEERGDSRWWQQNYFSRIAELDERDGWKLLGFDIANSWLQVNHSKPLFQDYEKAENFRVQQEDNEDLEIFVFGVYRQM